MSPAPERIRTITLPSPFTSSESTDAPEPLSLHLSRKAASYLLVHSASGDTAPHQYSIINCLASSDPFPLPDEDNQRCRMWLKIGPRASGEDGGENHGLVEHLEQQAIIRDTGIKSQQGEISQPLVELLLDEKELSHVCEGCGKFETASAESSSEDGEEESVPAEDRFKRCARCKMAYYCQASHWKSHKLNCQDCIAETDYEIELARRQILLKVYGRADHLSEADEGQSAKKSKLD
ncbi:BQ5605_C014g07624 [Microbotryum silenes-dioicae]|uniref:BQ5605_C014g07624 protein n=1 Tax=Microbotryum silenes-dioicae TaxID=796604 RepID=A0A2X0LY35_9BASI|nr:BQ5605_C014g07624 [Microbotryum silenes-dioicae]